MLISEFLFRQQKYKKNRKLKAKTQFKWIFISPDSIIIKNHYKNRIIYTSGIPALTDNVGNYTNDNEHDF